MKIRYLGHACFLLTNDAGKTLLMDPFDPSIGYPTPRERVDVVTASHGHHDHHYVEELPEGYALIDTAGTHAAAGFAITGLNSFHDDVQGQKRGANLIYLVETDGLRVAHLGDLGHMPETDVIARLKNVDVLLLPVGGYFTIDSAAAAEVMRAVDPALTIPMHYSTGANDLPISTERDFVRATGGRYAGLDELEFARDSLAGVLVMRHPE